MADSTSRYVAVLLQQGQDGAYAFISRAAVFKMQRRMDEVITSSKDSTEIDVWIESPGGDAHATYKLILDLRSRARIVRAIIPDYAKSAATLFLMGVDEIYMSAGADLGPLDVQISHPDREEITLSALDVVGSLQYLSEFAIQLALGGGGAIVKYTHLARSDVLRSILRFVADFMKPCVSKVDPHLVRRAAFQLKVAERYAKEMLQMRNVPESKKLSDKKAKELVHRLVNEYPVHEFVIGAHEARSLGLPIKDIKAYKHAKQLSALYDHFVASDDPMIDVVELNGQSASAPQASGTATTKEMAEKKIKKKLTKKKTRKKTKTKTQPE
jgi:hypothetical protein